MTFLQRLWPTPHRKARVGLMLRVQSAFKSPTQKQFLTLNIRGRAAAGAAGEAVPRATPLGPEPAGPVVILQALPSIGG